MKLSEKYRPQALAGIVGQRPVRMLQALAAEPYASCWLLEGSRGCGKTSAAYALAAELDCRDNCFDSSLHVTTGNDLGVDEAKRILQQTLRFKVGNASGFHLWLIEELEWLSKQCQTFLKTALETQLPRNAIVIATSNGATGLNRALLDRFTKLHFSGGPQFMEDCEERLREVWELEGGDPILFPQRTLMHEDDDGAFSLRAALDTLQQHLLMTAAVA